MKRKISIFALQSLKAFVIVTGMLFMRTTYYVMCLSFAVLSTYMFLNSYDVKTENPMFNYILTIIAASVIFELLYHVWIKKKLKETKELKKETLFDLNKKISEIKKEKNP